MNKPPNLAGGAENQNGGLLEHRHACISPGSVGGSVQPIRGVGLIELEIKS
jgi:hypothetical protein